VSQTEDSEYLLVVRYLGELRCKMCGGYGRSGRGAKCAQCQGNGFKSGEQHLLVSGKQVRRRR
jgi:DnaJ-class molecular chaperone